MHGGDRAYRILVGNSEDNIKTDFEEIGWEEDKLTNSRIRWY
jgi:hypothetical protein